MNFDSAQSASVKSSKELCGSTTSRTVLRPARFIWTGTAGSPPSISPDCHSRTPSAYTAKYTLPIPSIMSSTPTVAS